MRNLVILTLLSVSLFTGCSLSEDQNAVAKTLDQTMSALEKGDLDTLWRMSAPKAQTELNMLYEKMHRAVRAIDRLYPPEARANARRSVGGELIKDIDPKKGIVGPQFLKRFVQPEALRLDAAARDGLMNEGALITGDTAIIETSAGETFTFQRTPTGWKSGLIADLLVRNGRINGLHENVDAVLAALKAQREAWMSSNDAATPNGAFNLVRKAVSEKPIRVVAVYTLLDAAAKRALQDTLKTARTIQKRLQQGVIKSRRKALYKKHRIASYVGIQTDQKLLAHYASLDSFTPPIPMNTKPERIESTGKADQIILHTANGESVPMTHDPVTGYWLISDYDKIIKKALLKPLEQELDRLKSR